MGVTTLRIGRQVDPAPPEGPSPYRAGGQGGREVSADRSLDDLHRGVPPKVAFIAGKHCKGFIAEIIHDAKLYVLRLLWPEKCVLKVEMPFPICGCKFALDNLLAVETTDRKGRDKGDDGNKAGDDT